MNAVSKFDVARLKRGRGLPKYALPTIISAGGAITLFLLFLLFQLFLRYQYVEVNGQMWRIDRLTEQSCQVEVGGVRCGSPGTAATTRHSSSTSTSTSISTSVSLRPTLPKHKPKH